MYNGDPAHTSNARINMSFPLIVADDFSVFLNRESGTIVSEDKIFYSNTGDTNTINAIDLLTGDSLWTFIVPKSIGGIAFTPAVGHDVVLAGGQQASNLYGLDVNSGDVLWSSPIQSLYYRSPTIYDSLVYVASHLGLTCIDLITGETKWYHDVPTPQITPTVDSANVYYNAGGIIYAKDRKTGEDRWSNTTVSSGHGASYVLDEDYLYYGYEDTISALNKYTGDVLWQTNLDTNEVVFYSSMAALTDMFLIVKTQVTGLGKNQFRVLEKATGNIMNTYTGGNYTWSSPTIINNYMVDCGTNKILFMDMMTGDSIYALSGLGFGNYPTQVIAVKDKIIIAAQGHKIIILESMPSGIKNIEPDFHVEVFPNPASSETVLHLDLPKAMTIDLKVVSISGTVIKTEALNFLSQGKHTIPISLDGLSTGIYFIRLQNEQGVVTRKLVVR